MVAGNTPVIKAYLGDITDSSNQARAFAFYGMMEGVGTLGIFYTCISSE
jgi:hypothetical protein